MDGNTYNVNVTRKHKKAFQGRHETAMKLILLMKFYSRKTYIKLFYYKNWHKRSHFKQKLKELTALQSQCLVIWIFAFSFSCAKNKSLTDSLLISAQGQCLALGPPCLTAFIWRQHPQWVHSSMVTVWFLFKCTQSTQCNEKCVFLKSRTKFCKLFTKHVLAKICTWQLAVMGWRW